MNKQLWIDIQNFTRRDKLSWGIAIPVIAMLSLLGWIIVYEVLRLLFKILTLGLGG